MCEKPMLDVLSCEGDKTGDVFLVYSFTHGPKDYGNDEVLKPFAPGLCNFPLMEFFGPPAYITSLFLLYPSLTQLPDRFRLQI